MPRSFLRAACAVLAVLALVLAATPTSSKEEHWPDRPGIFSVDATLQGFTIDCPGTSPLQNVCEKQVFETCASGCGLDALPGFAYTGRVTAYIYGKSSNAPNARDVYLAYSCGYIAGSMTRVGIADSGGCYRFATADQYCVNGTCEYYMWPPFRLRGESSPGVGGVSPSGSWVVRLLG